MDGLLISDARQRTIVWDTENKVIHFDIKKDSIGFNKQIILKRDPDGKVEIKECCVLAAPTPIEDTMLASGL